MESKVIFKNEMGLALFDVIRAGKLRPVRCLFRAVIIFFSFYYFLYGGGNYCLRCGNYKASHIYNLFLLYFYLSQPRAFLFAFMSATIFSPSFTGSVSTFIVEPRVSSVPYLRNSITFFEPYI